MVSLKPFKADNATVAARRVRVVHWVARATGVPRFDDGPLAARVGALPSWELLSFAYVAEVRTGRRGWAHGGGGRLAWADRASSLDSGS